MIGAELTIDMGGLIGMLVFWGGLILMAIWLMSLLFPAATHHNHSNKNTGEKRVSPHDKNRL